MKAKFFKLEMMGIWPKMAQRFRNGNAHMLTGLKPLGIRKLMERERGFGAENDIMLESRTSLLAASLLIEQATSALGTFVTIANTVSLLDAVFRPILPFGVDSMLAAEFRIWVENTSKEDVPYLDIIGRQKALYHLVERYLEEKSVSSWAAA
ncbi:hypothetical protein F4808DRAFT_463096 [Astrocystis sublimbata]|nr:hypothetical protein F4808DRAFT_463096 [Astrocystis sublimbata]